MSLEKLGDTFQIVGPKNTFPKVTLADPSNSGYLLFALEIDRRPPIGFFKESQIKFLVSFSALSQLIFSKNQLDIAYDYHRNYE